MKSGTSLWLLVGSDKAMVKMSRKRGCEIELERFFRLLNTIRGGLDINSIIPSLQSVSLNSIYGRDTDNWVALGDAEPSLRASVLPIPTALGEFFASANNLIHLCYHDWHGPLGPFGVDLPRPEGLRPIVHIGAVFGTPPMIFGSPIHWLYDGPDDEDWSRLIQAIGRQVRNVSSLAAEGSHELDLIITCSTSQYGPANFDAHHDIRQMIYPPPTGPALNARILPPPLQAAMITELDAELRTLLHIPPTPEGVTSKRRWFSSAESQGCAACIFGIPK